VACDTASLGLFQQVVEVALVKQISMAAVLPAPLGKCKRFGGPELLREFQELVFGELVRMPVIKIKLGLVKHLLGLWYVTVDVSYGNRPVNWVQLVTELLSFL
jgi:hypothetical protein